jgi:ATP-dependent DNA helicase RecQ
MLYIFSHDNTRGAALMTERIAGPSSALLNEGGFGQTAPEFPLDKESVLKQYFGYTAFRPGQEEVINALLEGRDVLAVMPTGGGKSLCYQIPALLLPGLTLVISPLISLMKDQVEALQSSGVPAAFLNSALSRPEYADTISRALRGEYAILYISPERLCKDGFQQLTAALPVSLVVIDEAHCVSQWGHDFRASYLDIAGFIGALAARPVVAAFTATATSKVKEDILRLLELAEPLAVSTGFDRPNLYFEVQKPKDKYPALLECLRARKNKSGIIYCATRNAVEDVHRRLADQGFPATRYHAGLPDRERRENQDDFIYDRKPIMVATNAFGMGIDKSNVSYVIHYNMPKNIESYYQEAGRAGRDGEAADCILLYSPQDVRINQFLITKGSDDEIRDPAIIAHNEKLLKQMTFYATTADCFRSRLLSYFGEDAPSFCGNCSNCTTEFEEAPITLEAQKILSCVYRLGERGIRYGKSMVAEILRGGKSEKLRGAGLDTLSTYGIMTGTDPHRLRLMIDELVRQQYLKAEGEYPVLLLTEKSPSVLRGETQITMMLPSRQTAAFNPFQPANDPKGRMPPKAAAPGSGAAAGRIGRRGLLPVGEAPRIDETLLARLKGVRTALAKEASVPAYVIFSDATLRDMCARRPVTAAQFLEVSGVGKTKLMRYGETFMEVIRSFTR